MANSNMLVRVMADTKNYNANLAQASKTLSNFAKNNLTASGAVKQMTSAMTSMAAQYVGAYAAIRGMQKAIGDMVRINKQFEQGTANLASIIGKSREEISALTTQAKQLGATTRYTAMQITELQTNLARLGFTQQEILNSTTAVQAFATATGADLGEAANLAGAALRGFGLNATEMERVASVLSVSTTKSALSFEKLATAVPIVAPVAKQFGFTIEDTVTLLAKLSDAGMDASTAATATRNIFLKMANDSGKLSQALGRPVHSVEEFGAALKEMRDKGMSLNDILSMVGVRSTAAFAVFADNAETLKDFKDSITDCSDAMHKMEKEQINTLQGSLTIMQSAWEGLMLSFSESNGVIKTVVDNLSELLQTWTKWRNRNAGGDAAIKTYEMAESEVEKYGKQYIEGDRASGMSDDAIKESAIIEKAALEQERDDLSKVLKLWEKRYELIKSGQSGLAKGDEFAPLKNIANTTSERERLTKQVAQKNSNIAIQDYIISALTVAPTTTGTQGKGGGVVGGDKSLTAKSRADIEAQMLKDIADLDKVNKIKLGKEQEYEDEVFAIKLAAYERIKQLYAEDTKEYAQMEAKIAQLKIQHQGTQMRLAKQAEKEEQKQQTNLEKRNEKIKELNKSIDEMQNILASTADENTKAWAAEQLKQYNAELDKLNGKLEKTSATVKELPTAFENFQTGVDSIGDLVGAMDNLKSVGEDLASVFSGEKDAWESLMTVMQSGLSILQTIISVKEAINALEEVGIVLSKTKAASEQVEASTTQSAAGTIVAAEGQKATASLASAGADAAEGSAAAGKAVAGIPILGPILAVAAVASVLGVVLAAISKGKSAGNFSTGGIVPGNSYSGDNLNIGVNSQELVLNRAQTNNLASQLQYDPLGNLNLGLRVDGTQLLVLLNNVNRSKGGSRNFYSKVH